MPINYEALKQKQARRATSGWSPKDGDNPVRIFPHTMKYFYEDMTDFAHEFYSHFLTAEGIDTEVVRCLRDKKEGCPLCELSKRFRDHAIPEIKKAAQDIRGSERHLMNLMDLNDPSGGIQPYESGKMVYDGILLYVANASWGDILHPEAGRSFIINLNKKGKGGYYEYKVSPFPDKSSVVAHLTPDWQERIEVLVQSIPDYYDPSIVEKWSKVLGFTAVSANPVTVAMPGMPPFTPVYPPAPPVGVAVPQIPGMPAAPIAVPTVAAPPVAMPPMPPSAPPPAPMPPVAPAAMPPMPPAAPAAMPPVAPPPVVVPSLPPPAPTFAGQTAGQTAEDAEVIKFVTEHAPLHGISYTSKPGGPKKYPIVPSCYSEGLGPDGKLVNPRVGYNPAIFPCQKGCPVKSDCQIRQLGL